MKNPFGKKHKSLDSVINSNSAAEVDLHLSSGGPNLTKTEAVPVDNTLNASNKPTGRGPTVASHGFEYDESTDLPPQSDAAINPYNFNETEDTNAVLSLNRYNVSNWYALNGRLGRVKFLAYSFIWFLFLLIPALLAVMMSGPALMGALATQSTSFAGLLSLPMIIGILLCIPAYIYSIFILPRRRLHDIGKSGWWLLLYLVPIASLVLLYWIYIKAGDAGANEYGLPSAPNTTAEKVLASIFPALFTLGVLAAVIVPMLVDMPETPALSSDPDISESGIEEADMSENEIDSNDSASLDNIDSVNQQTDGIDAQEGMETSSVDAMPNTDAATIQQEGQETNPTDLRSNETLDPELQAEIDAALNGGQSASTTNIQPESESGDVDASYEAFLKASEKPILVDRSPAE